MRVGIGGSPASVAASGIRGGSGVAPSEGHASVAIRVRAATAVCLFVVAAAVAASGCGPTHRAATAQARILARGRAVFARSCSPCHSLVGHEEGTSGGDLVDPQLTVGVIESFTRIMPASPGLSSSDVAAVAAWVYAVSRQGRR